MITKFNFVGKKVLVKLDDPSSANVPVLNGILMEENDKEICLELDLPKNTTGENLTMSTRAIIPLRRIVYIAEQEEIPPVTLSKPNE
jgi:hypothetical protein